MMQCMSKRAQALAGVLLLTALGFLAALPARAQDNVVVVPLSCMLCETRMAPDGSLVAAFETWAAVNGFASDTDMLAITLVDANTGKLVTRLTGQADFTADAAFSPGGRWLASLHTNGRLRLWDLQTRKPVWEREVPIAGGGLTFTPDGRTIVLKAGGLPQMFLFVDRQSGAVRQMMGYRFATLREYLDRLNLENGELDFAYSGWALAPDGKQIVSVTLKDEIGLWDVTTGAYRQLRAPSLQEEDYFKIRYLGFTPDGESIYFSYGEPGHLQIWNRAAQTDTLRLAPEVTLAPHGLALSPDGKSFAAVQGGERPTVVVAPIADKNDPRVVTALPSNLKYGADALVFFTPDGRRLIVGGAYAPDFKNALVIVQLGK